MRNIFSASLSVWVVFRCFVLVYLFTIVVIYFDINGPAAIQAVSSAADSGVVRTHCHLYLIQYRFIHMPIFNKRFCGLLYAH